MRGEILVEPSGTLAGTIDLEGTPSVRVDVRFDGGFSTAFCLPCVPGETISFGSSITSPFSGSVRYRGDEFVVSPSNSGGVIDLVAPSFVLPAAPSGSVTFQFPFTASAWVFTDNDPRISVRLTGTGQVTGRFNVFRGQFDVYTLESLRYDFNSADPIPEPATMTLLGIGLAAGWTARRRQSRPNR